MLLDPDEPQRWADAIVQRHDGAVLRARLRTAAWRAPRCSRGSGRLASRSTSTGASQRAIDVVPRHTERTLSALVCRDPESVDAAMISDPLVSIVIVTWNGRQYLDACLSAVAAQGGVSAETILVDNASTDGTVAYVRERFPWVRVVALTENRGFAGGNNAGVREARGRFVALLNNDTVPEPGWLQALVDGVNEEAGFALVTSQIVYMHDPGLIDSAGDSLLDLRRSVQAPSRRQRRDGA